MTERKPLIRKLESDDELRSAIPIVMKALAECIGLSRRNQLVGQDDVTSYLSSFNILNGDFWIAELDGKIVGYTEGNVSPANREGYVSNYVYVSPENRKNGIAKDLKGALFQRAKELGCTYVRTSVHPDNEASLALQKSIGAQLTPLGSTVLSRINL